MQSPTKVFISSVCTELMDLRFELFEYLTQAGLAPKLSEIPCSDFKVNPNENTIETCLENVKDSDILLCILSRSYGNPVAAELPRYTGKSVTHLEYEEAVRAKKPTYMFLRDHLQGDYRIWKNNGKPKEGNYYWVQDANPVRLFKLINEHEDRGSEGIYWLNGFHTSVDLKKQLEHLLVNQVGTSMLKRLINQKELPVLSIRVGGILELGNLVNGINIVITNASPVAAFDATIRIDNWPAIDLGTIKAGTDLSPHCCPLVCKCEAPGSSHLVLTYSTLHGYRIEEGYIMYFEARDKKSASCSVTKKYVKFVEGFTTKLYGPSETPDWK